MIPTAALITNSSAGLFLLSATFTAWSLHQRYLARTIPPKCLRHPHTYPVGFVEGETRGENPINPPLQLSDDLFWLRDDDRKDPAILAHLRAENTFAHAACAPQATLRTTLFKELLSRMAQNDESPPYPWGPWLYQWKLRAGEAHHVWVRRPRTPSTTTTTTKEEEEEVVLLDENLVAAGRAMCDVHCMEPSPDHRVIAWSVDFNGEEIYEIAFKGVGGASSTSTSASASASSPPPSTWGDVIRDTSGDVEWGAQGECVFYATLDDAHRPYRVHRHVMGTPQSQDVVLFEEGDERFSLEFTKSLSGHYLFISSSSKTTTEVHALALVGGGGGAGGGQHQQQLRCLLPRQEGVLYEVEHYAATTSTSTTSTSGEEEGGGFVILTNSGGALNFRVYLAPPSSSTTTGGGGGGGVSGGCLSPPSQWLELLPPSTTHYYTGITAFSGALVVSGRSEGLPQLWVLPLPKSAEGLNALLRNSQHQSLKQQDSAAPFTTATPTPTFRIPHRDGAGGVIGLAGGNAEWEAAGVRFSFSSPRCPPTTCFLDFLAAFGGGGTTSSTSTTTTTITTLATTAPIHAISILKEKRVPNVNLDLYATAKFTATASDGTQIPVSLTYRPSAHGLPNPPPVPRGSYILDAPTDSAAAPATTPTPTPTPTCPLPAPSRLFLKGYGSYGYSYDPRFSTDTLSLCDRGCVVAVAHVRGGCEKGRGWYELEGKLLTKKNTFTDFVAAAEGLIGAGWSERGRVGIYGASAGGLLMGVCLNTRPELWGAVVSSVGFVDVVASVADPTVPLAIPEWEEWGNPNMEPYLSYMLSYSPLNTLPLGDTPSAPRRRLPFPPTLLTGGLFDTRVCFWEPAKYAQRLRECATKPSNILLKTDMGAGHFSWSDRFENERETAFELAFILHHLK